MSKPIKLTDDLIKDIRGMKMADGKLAFTWADLGQKAYITFTPAAFAKMVMLLQHFESEVAWHGVAKRDDVHDNAFNITDILVYPQLVSGSTVNTDQAEYERWLYQQDDEVFNNLKMQGHSHVNFATSPSGVDLEHQEKILNQLEDEMFYIFMIWNKKFEHTVKIYDLKNNILYEDKDISFYIGEEGVNLDEFIKGAKDLVKARTYTTTYQKPATPASTQSNVSTFAKTTTPTTTTPSASTPSTAPVSAVGQTTKPKEKNESANTYAAGQYPRYPYYWPAEDDVYGSGK